MKELNAVLSQVRGRIEAKLSEMAEDLHHGSEFLAMTVRQGCRKVLTIEKATTDVNGDDLVEPFYTVSQPGGCGAPDEQLRHPSALQTLHIAAEILQQKGMSATEAYEKICNTEVVDDDLPF